MPTVIAAFAGKAAGVISLIAVVPYIIAILRGETRPNKATWWVWTAVGLMAASSYYASGAGQTIWFALSYVVGPISVALLSVKYGEGEWSRFDRICLMSAGGSLALWMIFSSPLVALLLNLVIDFMGALPTIRKAYHDPSGEDRIAWALYFFGALVNMFAIETFEFSIVIYPIYMFVVIGMITVLVFRKKAPAKS